MRLIAEMSVSCLGNLYGTRRITSFYPVLLKMKEINTTDVVGWAKQLKMALNNLSRPQLLQKNPPRRNMNWNVIAHH